MDRKHFLRALGLITATATLPIDKVAALLPVEEVITPEQLFDEYRISGVLKLRLRDIVQLKDGTRAIVTKMGNFEDRICTLTPLYASQDIGGGVGSSMSFNENTLPELETMAACAGEGTNHRNTQKG